MRLVFLRTSKKGALFPRKLGMFHHMNKQNESKDSEMDLNCVTESDKKDRLETIAKLKRTREDEEELKEHQNGPYKRMKLCEKNGPMSDESLKTRRPISFINL